MNSELPSELREWRKRERARLLELRRSMPVDAWRHAGAATHDLLVKRLPPGKHDLVGCYWPIRREFDCLPFMRMVLAAGGRVALPVVVARDRPLEFRCWREDTAMHRGVWNIPHPAAGPPVEPQVLVIALVGFDDEGFRLGYGAGYYDATIAAMPARPYCVGVGFEFSRISTIHPQPHDRPMDAILTERGVREGWARDAGSGARGSPSIVPIERFSS